MPLSIFLVQNRFGPGPKMIFSQLRFTFNHPKKPKMILDLMKDWGIRRVRKISDMICDKNSFFKGDKKIFSVN